jgi:AcrR family transcriptional regulator
VRAPGAAPASVPGGERRGRKKGAPPPRTDAILEACAQLFVRQGYADTSLRQLMAAARVSTTAFYARFASRDAVLEAIARDLLGSIAAQGVARLGQARSAEDAFAAGVDVLCDAVRDKRALVRLLLGEAGATPQVRAALGDALAALAALLESQLGPRVQKGALSAAQARAVSWALVGALKVQLERWALYEQIDDDALAPALRATADVLLPALGRPRR